MITYLGKKIWGRSRKSVNGERVIYEQCVKCGTKQKPHYLNGMCRRCFEMSDERRAYKKNHANKKVNKPSR